MACANVAPDHDSLTAILMNLVLGAVKRTLNSIPRLNTALSVAVGEAGGAPDGGPVHT